MPGQWAWSLSAGRGQVLLVGDRNASLQPLDHAKHYLTPPDGMEAAAEDFYEGRPDRVKLFSMTQAGGGPLVDCYRWVDRVKLFSMTQVGGGPLVDCYRWVDRVKLVSMTQAGGGPLVDCYTVVVLQVRCACRWVEALPLAVLRRAGRACGCERPPLPFSDFD